VGCYIWYSEERTGRGRSPPRPLLAVPNETAYPSTARVPIILLLYNGPLGQDVRWSGSETPPPYALQSSRFGSEPPSVEDGVDVWLRNLKSCMPKITTTMIKG